MQDATVEVWHEQLRVPLSWWLLGAAFVGTVVWVVWVVSPGLPALSAGAVAAVVVVVAMQRWSSTVIAVESGPQRGLLVAGRARLPLSVVSAVSALSADELRRQSGVDADARAHLVLPPFVPTGVRVDLADPADPTPYWLVATRHPEQLTAALTTALTAVRD